jgi:1-acyl-sn-glycerol-3-phosphate acyltransferase
MTASISIQEYVTRQERYRWRRAFLRGLIRTVGFHLLCKTEVIGSENIPADGPTILMMGHISAIDPVLCLGAVTSRYVIPMTKIENARNPLFGLLVKAWGAYTVRRGEFDRAALTNSIELLKSGQIILIAPEGTRHPEGLQQPRDGMAYIATKADAVIVPAALSDAVDFSKRWKRLRRAQARVTFGQPFRFRTGGRARVPRLELAQMMQEAMYQLALAQPDPSLRGVYGDLSRATTDHLEFIRE